MKTRRLLLLLTGIGLAVPAYAADEAPKSDPGSLFVIAAMGDTPAPGKEKPNFNPDPGATKKPVTAPFYETPPNTPPDYGKERDPLLELPHSPLIDLHPVHKVWQNRDYPEGQLPPGTTGVPDRWALDIPVWMRYNTPETEAPYQSKVPRLWDPYKLSILKGDAPILGQDIFLALTATSFTSYEARNVPVAAGVSTSTGNSPEFFGHGNQMEVDQFATFSVDLFKGETVFQPVTWLLHLQPVYNVNYTRVQENGLLSVDPRGSGSQSDNGGVFTNNPGNGSNTPSGGFDPTNPGNIGPGNPGGGFQHAGNQQFGDRYTTRTKDFISLQEGFFEVHIADLSDNYDFVSVRVGNQHFNSDFRGFVFNDTNLGIRVFGNADSNRWQYNAAFFDMREKDTYSELNSFNPRHEYVFIANVYRQDFITKGYTAQLSFLANYDFADEHYDRTGNLVTPANLGGPVVPHDVKTYYFGINGDGHWGRFNITNSFYEVIGRDDSNGLAGQPVDINAQMAALELSYDQDWVRFKASLFYGSGDDKPDDNKATGFDTILDHPSFAGGPFSYFQRQGFLFGDTGVLLKQRDSLVLDLRSSKTEGQSNFVNPGVLLMGVGTEMDLYPTLKLYLNANYIQMVNAETANFALHTNNITNSIGWDLSAGIKYRPLLTNNIIISAGLGALIPSEGYRAIYQSNTIPVPGYGDGPSGHVDAFLYSGFASVTLTY